MKFPIEHVQIPVRIEREEKIDVDYDLDSLAKKAIKMQLLAELDELEKASS